jgi:hypothetical protein
MIDFNHLLGQFPQVSNRGAIQLVPTKLFVDWFNYVNIDGITMVIGLPAFLTWKNSSAYNEKYTR